jgi:hypothetical protein
VLHHTRWHTSCRARWETKTPLTPWLASPKHRIAKISIVHRATRPVNERRELLFYRNLPENTRRKESVGGGPPTSWDCASAVQPYSVFEGTLLFIAFLTSKVIRSLICLFFQPIGYRPTPRMRPSPPTCLPRADGQCLARRDGAPMRTARSSVDQPDRFRPFRCKRR